MISLPEKRDDPEPVAIVTLCGMAASAFLNAIVNGVPAGALKASGTNRNSCASMARVTGRGVGLGVGFGVGLDVGFGVGLGVGVAVGRAVGRDVTADFAVGAGAAVADGVWMGAAVAAGLGPADPAADAIGVLDGTDVPVGPGLEEARGARDGEFGVEPGSPGETDSGAGAPQAMTSNPTAISRRGLATGTAAL